METIDLNRLREALPDRAKVSLGKTKETPSSVYIRCEVYRPSLELDDFEQVKQWQREIIGEHNISEIYTKTEGSLWLIYLKRVPMEFLNCSDENVQQYAPKVNMKEVRENMKPA